MPFSITNTQDRLILKLEGEITIRHAQDLAARLVEGLGDRMAVEVDAAGVRDVDTCILQLLCSLRKTSRALAFEHPSEAFLGAAERSGLRRQLLGAREDL
jgi:anti-anti-sigma regulatory factor